MKYQVSFRAKTWYLHMWKYHRCYGYIINRAFHIKKRFGSSLVFIFLFSCWKNIEEKFRISAQPCNILYVFFKLDAMILQLLDFTSFIASEMAWNNFHSDKKWRGITERFKINEST